MKNIFAFLLIILGILLLIGQIMVYSTSGFLPPMHEELSFTRMSSNLGLFLGHNTIGIVGGLLLFFGFKVSQK